MTDSGGSDGDCCLIFILIIVLCCVMFCGEPDLLDAIIKRVGGYN